MTIDLRFISDAAHQMRTPLTGLKMQAQLAAREEDPQQLRYALQNISTSVDRASHLVNQLLTLARAEASGVSAQVMEPVELDRLLSEIVGEWVMVARERLIDIGFESSARAVISGNVFLLREMINNLLDNALRYTPESGRVTARSLGEHGQVVLEIEDSGIGCRAACDAGIHPVITVSTYTQDDDFTGAALVVSDLGEPEAPATLLRGRDGLRFSGIVDLPLIHAISR